MVFKGCSLLPEGHDYALSYRIHLSFFRALGPRDLMEVSLSGVADAVNKHSGPGAEPKGIKAHFTLDESGLVSLTNVDYVVETLGGAEPSTLQKIGSGLSNLFGGGATTILC